MFYAAFFAGLAPSTGVCWQHTVGGCWMNLAWILRETFGWDSFWWVDVEWVYSVFACPSHSLELILTTTNDRDNMGTTSCRPQAEPPSTSAGPLQPALSKCAPSSNPMVNSEEPPRPPWAIGGCVSQWEFFGMCVSKAQKNKQKDIS